MRLVTAEYHIPHESYQKTEKQPEQRYINVRAKGLRQYKAEIIIHHYIVALCGRFLRINVNVIQYASNPRNPHTTSDLSKDRTGSGPDPAFYLINFDQIQNATYAPIAPPIA